MPWVLVASTAVSLSTTTRAGVREVRVLGSLLAYRLEQATGTPADPALVKKLAVELYLAPKRKPDVTGLDLPLAQLARKWLFRGVFGRDTRRAAEKALDAAERLDLERVLETRRTCAVGTSPAAGQSLAVRLAHWVGHGGTICTRAAIGGTAAGSDHGRFR